jgi:tetratricopeptide (TPR) repeat protein
MSDLLRRYPLDRIPPADRPYGGLGSFYARLGDVEMVRKYRREFEASRPPAERSPGSTERWDGAEAWARKDYVAATTALRAARIASSCAHCGLYDEAEAWERSGSPDSARVLLERAVSTSAVRDQSDDALHLGPAYQRLGELYEAKGDKAKARDYYQRFVDLWRAADPVFQPQVAEAKRRLAALGSDASRQP